MADFPIPLRTPASDPRNSARVFHLLLAAFLALGWTLGFGEPADSSQPSPDEESTPAGPDQLTREEREHVRSVFTEVWDDPDVVAARQAVHEATRHYRETVKAAVRRTDPSVIPLMEKMHRQIRSSAMRHRRSPPGSRKRPGGPRPLPRDPGEAVRRILEIEFRHLELPAEDKERLQKTAQDVLANDELSSLLRTAIETREPPASLQARREFREAFFRALAEADPWVEKLLRHKSPRKQGPRNGEAPRRGLPPIRDAPSRREGAPDDR